MQGGSPPVGPIAAWPGRLVREAAITLHLLFGRRWRWMTLAALLTCAITVRLGFWQLDRLAQRRASNAQLISRLSAPPLELTATFLASLGSGPAAEALVYRPVVVRGTFDFADEVALPNQVWNGQIGLDLLTPLVVEGTDRAVLVDRGWIPATEASPQQWAQYDAPSGVVQINGWVHPSRQGSSWPAPGSQPNPRRLVTDLDLAHLQALLHHRLAPLVVAESPAAGDEAGPPPHRHLPQPDLSEGVHKIAAIQWFIISGIILVGQVIFVRRQGS